MRAVLLSVVAACGSPSDTTIDIAHDSCAPLSITPVGASTDQLAAVEGGLALWHAHGIRGLGEAGGAAIELRFDDASPAFHGLYDDERGVIYLNRALAPDALSIVVAHELGHAYGLPHIDDRSSLMNAGNTVTPPNAGDRAALDALWGRCD